MKNNLPFFSHDNDAGTHWKHKALRVKYGWEGYGRFWRLNELISHAENCKLRVENRQIRANSAAELGLSVQEFNEYLDFLTDPDQCGLIKITKDGALTTDRTQEDLSRVMKSRLWDRNRRRKEKDDFRSEKDSFQSENEKIRTGKTTEQSRIEFIDDDGELQNSCRSENANSGTEISKTNSPSFTTAELRSALAKSAPKDLTISDKLLEDLTVRLSTVGLGLDYVTWYGDYVRRQPNLANPGGYFRAHFGELADRYRTRQGRQAASDKPPPEEERADPADIEKAFSGLPWHRPYKQKDGEEETRV